MPPIVRSLDVQGHPARIRRRSRDPLCAPPPGARRVRALPARRRVHRHLAEHVCVLHRAGVPPDGCAVFVADYRLAPEFPYPAGAEDASAVYAELLDRGIPCERIFLAGDSGGGGLANTVLLEDPERIRPVRPAGLLVFSPEVDLRLDEKSVTENADHDILPWNIPTTAYLHGADVGSSPVSPLSADLSGFPPTCVTWGGDEMFRDPIRRYVDCLRAAGVPTEAQEFEGMFHVFEILMPWAVNSHEVFALVRALRPPRPGRRAAPRRPRPVRRARSRALISPGRARRPPCAGPGGNRGGRCRRAGARVRAPCSRSVPRRRIR